MDYDPLQKATMKLRPSSTMASPFEEPIQKIRSEAKRLHLVDARIMHLLKAKW
jgi:hypothetical protein